jgi:hypothetical protein
MTKMQRAILIGSIILPGGSLILIFSQLGRLIIRRLVKAKTLRIFGKIDITQKEIEKQLYERTDTYRDEEQNRDAGISGSDSDDGNGSSQNFIFWN